MLFHEDRDERNSKKEEDQNKAEESKVALKVNAYQVMANRSDTAIKEAGNSFKDIKISNVSDFPTKGQNGIILKPLKEGTTIAKAQYFNALVEYVTYFVGEDVAKKIKIDDLYAITQENGIGKDFDELTDRNKDIKNGGEEGSSGGETGTEPSTPTTSSPTSESKKQWKRQLVDLIFEEAAPSGSSAPSDSPTDPEPPSDTDPEGSSEDSEVNVLGYFVVYTLKINGKYAGASFLSRAKDAISNSSDKGEALFKGLFGDLISDLQSVYVTSNRFGKMNIGKVLDGEWWRDKLNVQEIDSRTICSDIDQVWDEEFRNNDVRIRILENSGLKTVLERQGVFSTEGKDEEQQEIAKRLKERFDSIDAKSSIVIKVDQKDPYYGSYDEEKVADICTRAFGNYNRIFSGNKISKDDVIKIPKATDEFNDVSIRSKSSLRYGNLDASPTKTFKESSYRTLFGPIVNESLSAVPEVSTYQTDLNNEIENQVKSILPKYASSLNDYGLKDSKTYASGESFKLLNDSRMKQNILNGSSEVVVLEINKVITQSDLSSATIKEESDDTANDLIHLLFEDHEDFYMVNESDADVDKLKKYAVKDAKNILPDATKVLENALINVIQDKGFDDIRFDMKGLMSGYAITTNPLPTSVPKKDFRWEYRLYYMIPNPISAKAKQILAGNTDSGQGKKEITTDLYVVPHKRLKGKYDYQPNKRMTDDGYQTSEYSGNGSSK